MTDFAGPYNSGGGANFEEVEWREMMSALFPDGVIDGALNMFAVTAGSGMTVSVDTGRAVGGGSYFRGTASATLTISAADSTNPRIDLVVIHWDLVAHTGARQVITGTPAGSPSAPTVTQSTSVWEIPLAQVLVPAGASSSASFTITDERVFIGPLERFAANKSGVGGSVDAVVLLNGDATHPARLELGGWNQNPTAETHIRAMHNGSGQDMFQSVPDTTGSGPATIKVGGDPSQGIHVRLGNMSVFSGTGTQTGVAHGLGQTPSLVLVMPNQGSAIAWSVNNIGSTTCDVHIASGAWTAIAIAQS